MSDLDHDRLSGSRALPHEQSTIALQQTSTNKNNLFAAKCLSLQMVMAATVRRLADEFLASSSRSICHNWQ